MKRLILTCGLLLLLISCTQANPETLAPTDPPPAPTATATRRAIASPVPPCDEVQGEIRREEFESGLYLETMSYLIYLPPCYSSSNREYPILILLHGRGVDDTQWDTLGIDEAADLGYVRGSLPPMIIVMPGRVHEDYGSDISPFPDMVVDEIVPDLESKFCTWDERSVRAIGGVSRGGYWAYWIGLTHPELFSRVGGHSPFFYEPAEPSDQNPINLLDSSERVEAVTMYLDAGANDLEVEQGLNEFVAHLFRRGINPVYVVNPVGDHSDAYWSAHTADYLEFYADGWPRSVDLYPPCE